MWRGIIIKEGLKDVSVLDHVYVVESRIEEEGLVGYLNILHVEVDDSKINKVISLLKTGMRKGWYFYFWKGKDIYIVFKNKSFKIKKGDSLDKIKEWAFKEYNILPEMIQLKFF